MGGGGVYDIEVLVFGEERVWVCTIVENECRATRNFQLGLKGLVRDSLASAFTATPLNSLVTVH